MRLPRSESKLSVAITELSGSKEAYGGSKVSELRRSESNQGVVVELFHFAWTKVAESEAERVSGLADLSEGIAEVAVSCSELYECVSRTSFNFCACCCASGGGLLSGTGEAIKTKPK